MSEKSSASGGVGLGGLLLVLFVALKLLGVIHWSWWWVLSPLWIPLALGIVVFGVVLVWHVVAEARR